VVKVREEIFIQDIGIDVKDNLSSSLIELDIEKYKDNSSGVYQSWFNNDIQMIQEKGLRNIFAIIYSLSGVVFSLYALLKYHWIISLITIIGTGILIYLPKIFNKKLHNIPPKIHFDDREIINDGQNMDKSLFVYFLVMKRIICCMSRELQHFWNNKVKDLDKESSKREIELLNYGFPTSWLIILTIDLEEMQ